MFWLLGGIMLAAVLYGLHRFCLFLEARGHLYYRDKKPKPGGTPAFFPLQEIIQPQIEHVTRAQNTRTTKADDRSGDPPKE